MEQPFGKLLVVSHVVHYHHGGRLFAYGPYAREIDVWADLFAEVVVAAPCRREAPPGDCLPFTRPNVSVRPQMETGGTTWKAKARQVLALPLLVWGLARAMRGADAIHVRCPGNLGLLGVLLAPLFSRRLVSKYAGQWSGFPGEPWTWWLQRALLRSPWWRGPVTVYGHSPGAPAHVVPFFTSALTAEQVGRAGQSGRAAPVPGPLRVLFVGRLTASKNVAVLISAVARLSEKQVPVRCVIVGEGPERAALEAQVRDLALGGTVQFTGGLSFEQVLGHYEQADVLVLASETEGWPKAITEGMAFGLACIGSERGLVPEILGEGRGLVVPPGDVAALAGALGRIASAPQEFVPMRERAAAWARQFSLDGLKESLRRLLAAHWGIPAGEAPAAAGGLQFGGPA